MRQTWLGALAKGMQTAAALLHVRGSGRRCRVVELVLGGLCLVRCQKGVSRDLKKWGIRLLPPPVNDCSCFWSASCVRMIIAVHLQVLKKGNFCGRKESVFL